MNSASKRIFLLGVRPPRIVGNLQALATAEAPGVVALACTPDSRARALVPGPGFSSALPCLVALSFEHNELVPETKAQSHGWLVTRRLKRHRGSECREDQVWATSAEKCRTISNVSLGAQEVSPGTKHKNITTHVSAGVSSAGLPDTALGRTFLNLVLAPVRSWHIILGQLPEASEGLDVYAATGTRLPSFEFVPLPFSRSRVKNAFRYYIIVWHSSP